MSGRGVDPHDLDTMTADDPEYAVMRHATAVVMELVDETGWVDNPKTGTNGVVSALFGKGKAAPAHGDKAAPEVEAARREWLERCRAWMRGRGLEPASTQISPSEQRAYEAASGDIWQAVRAEVGK